MIGIFKFDIFSFKYNIQIYQKIKEYLFMENINLLKSVNLFSRLNDKHLKIIASILKERKFAAGDAIVKQGEEGIGLFIIKSGKVKVTKKLASGKEIDIAIHGSGDFIGEISLLDNKPRTATVVAMEDIETLAMTHWDFMAVLKDTPEICLDIIPVIVERFRETNEQLLELRVN